MKKIFIFVFLMMISFVSSFNSQNIKASEDIKYLALGDSTIDGRNTYVDKFAEGFLNLNIKDTTKYNKLSQTGTRLEDLLAVLDSEFVTDEYGKTKEAKLDSDKYLPLIKDADLISLSYNNMDYALRQLKMSSLIQYPNMWDRYFDDEKLQEVNEILDLFRSNLNGSGVPMVDMVILVIESYAYNYVSTVFNYPKVVSKIKEINPSCDIISVEMYNPLNGIILQIGDFTIDVGDYFNQLIELVDSLYDGVGMEETDSYIVSSKNVETKYTEMLKNTTTQPEYTQILTTIISNNTIFLPSENGKVYLKDQMITTFNSICNHVANPDDGDCTTDLHCSLCNKVLEYGRTEHSGVVDPKVDSSCFEYGLTEGAHCEICGTVIVAQDRIDMKDHTYDNACDTDCNVCHKERSIEHAFGDWSVTKEATKDAEGEESRTCSVCNHTETRSIEKLESNNGVLIATICCFSGAACCFIASSIYRSKHKNLPKKESNKEIHK